MLFVATGCQEGTEYDEMMDTIDVTSTESIETPVRQGEQCYKDNPNLHHRTEVYDIIRANDSVFLIAPRSECGDIVVIEV